MLPIKVSENALTAIKEIIKNKNIPKDYGLRIGIKGGGGCLGFSYILGFDKEKPTDDKFDISGIPIYIEKKHLMYLIDVSLDYLSDSEHQGFCFEKNSIN